jgi:hypothetical protein
MTTLDYTSPETALLDLDWLIDQAALFITANAVDCELEARRPGHHLGLFESVPLRAEVKRYLAHLSVEEIYDPYLDRMSKLELNCRKEEVSRRLTRMIAGYIHPMARRAA